MIGPRFKYILLLFVLSLSSGSFSADDSSRTDNTVLLLSDSFFSLVENNKLFPEKYFFYYPDTAGILSIEDVSSSGFQHNFLPIPFPLGKIDSLIIQSKIFWQRIRVKNSSANIGEWWFSCEGAKTTELFFPHNFQFLNKKTGFRFPLKDRDVKMGEGYALSQFISSDTVKTIFFRQEYQKESRISRITLVDKEEIIAGDRVNRYVQGAFFGLLVIIALYNLLLYFFVKEASNIFYAVYLFCVTLSYLSTSGYGFELFWPDYPGNSVWIITIGWACAGFFYVLFGRAYLHTRLHLPKWNRILNIHLVGSVVALIFIIAIVIYLNYNDMIGSNNVSVHADSTVAGMLTGLGVLLTVLWIFLAFFIVLIPAFFCLRKGFQPAKYFLYASISLAVGIVVQIFGDSDNIFTDNAFQFGMGLQAIFFSLGLGYRINLLQEEKLGAQEKALEVLEQKVQERTFEVVKQKEIVEDKQKEIIDSITYARRLQEAILPPVDLIKKYLPDSFVLYIPKDIIAGDFYWMETCAPAKSGASVSGGEIVFIAAADCTGHGVPGAMVSVVCSNALNRAVKEFGLRDTGKILDKVTDLVLETFEKSSSEVKDGMDISLLSLEFADRNSEENLSSSNSRFLTKVQWSGANNPLWYIQNLPASKESEALRTGQVKEVKADKQPIGKFHIRKPFTTHTLSTTGNQMPGTFYLFTDGFPDQFGGPKKKKFMYKRLEEKITAINNLPLNEQKKILVETFQDWKGNIEQVDDVTVIGIRI